MSKRLDRAQELLLKAGELIQEERREMGITQIEMQRLTGIPQPVISNLERGLLDAMFRIRKAKEKIGMAK
jgi:predicted transcriptional regulator